jgi:hypothetical protein
MKPTHPYGLIRLFCWAAFICTYLLFCETCSAQTVRRRGIAWASPVVVPVRLNGYEVKSIAEPNGTIRAYIKRTKDREWLPFYEVERFLLVTLGNRKQLVLINDCPATKFCRTMVVDLRSHRKKQLDRSADEMYRRNARPDNRLVIIPQAYAFSPDDRTALINMELIYVSVPVEPTELAERLSASYKNWWYVVSSQTGRVMREYRTSKVPKRWWRS